MFLPARRCVIIPRRGGAYLAFYRRYPGISGAQQADGFRPWFHEHREEYEKLVVEPMAELVTALTPAMLEIDPAIMCIPKVGKHLAHLA